MQLILEIRLTFQCQRLNYHRMKFEQCFKRLQTFILIKEKITLLLSGTLGKEKK